MYLVSYTVDEGLNPQTLLKENFYVCDDMLNLGVQILDVLYFPIEKRVSVVICPRFLCKQYTVGAESSVLTLEGESAEGVHKAWLSIQHKQEFAARGSSFDLT